MSVTFTDIFCGAGGSSIGLSAAGFELKLAANHWQMAIDTHSANFRDAEHLCADVNNYDMRRLPTTDILWASPICTEISPAGGRARSKRPAAGQLDLFDEPLPSAAFDRTRATAYDVIRATEVHRYAAVLVENVVEFATDWELFDWWLSGMLKLGYRHQIVCVSSAHVGGQGVPYAPQWRDRLYIVFTRTGMPLPDVAPRPLAWCFTCAEHVHGVQWWKNAKRPKLGKYRQQYLYRCPNRRCRHEVVEPYVSPAAAAIDWSDLGTRIGDRTRPLAPKTVERIAAGLALFARTTMVSVNHDGDGRAYPADGAPLPSRTVRIGDGVASPPMLVPGGGTWNTTAYPVDDPMRTRLANEKGYENLVVPPGAFLAMLRRNGTTSDPVADALATVTSGGRHHGLVTPPFVMVNRTNNRPYAIDEPLAPVATGNSHALVSPDAFYVKHYGGHADPRNMSKRVDTEPLGVITAADHHSLVIPYRRGNATTTGEPLHTLGTRDSAALVEPAISVDECLFRMLKPREHLRAQAFPDSYVVKGNKGEQTMQAGNAVSANVAQWLGRAVAVVLGGAV